METDTDRLVVLDVRPYSDYVVGHIKNAFTLRFSSILLRRLRQNKVSVLDLLIDEASQCIFRERTSRPHAVIVVYDNNTTELDISEPDHRNSLHVTVQHLLNSNYHVRFLRGGFNGFQDMVDFCEANPNNTPPQAALSLSSLSLDRNMTPSTPIERHHRDKAPAQILPYLYVGAEAHAENRELLKRLNVTHVLNLTTHDSRKYPEFGYHQIAIRDSWNQDMSKCFEDAFEYINKCRAEGGCVLLHCVAGISRSATVAIAYLMTFRELDLNAAYSTVKERRPCIAPNLDFMGELQRYEEKLAAKRQGSPCTLV
ncbi:uncharacterized protein MONBRDRAFT_8130 [Monosiga brevicollis MX1]|uniref:Protein-serine/threonine phosphatase n=1 Tax=Monosiga brevicollis TaxID=81824 RepID=A9UZ47_MONBE|nr:uncharacterized protein MONBRDRAFT_8130 [Monosiga brevicollis MX1]EDQ89570.1 predicted protein [Monosiga brevicollis MX1]|eukprot:XP_001745599.1 hypothetical protein [Monosiga brevicollis MX1]